MSENAIHTLLLEERRYAPPPEFAAQATHLPREAVLDAADLGVREVAAGGLLDRFNACLLHLSSSTGS